MDKEERYNRVNEFNIAVFAAWVNVEGLVDKFRRTMFKILGCEIDDRAIKNLDAVNTYLEQTYYALENLSEELKNEESK